MTTKINEEPDKVDLKSLDIGEEKRSELLRLFPEVRTEGGKIDFDRLKLTLGEAVDVGRERYGMNWPGKAECFRAIQAPSMATLRPMKDESVNWDTTENLIIEGDNFEVLKLLQKAYLGSVKMIYIDPPYNTGKDFIYPDNFTESLQTYLEYSGQVDAHGKAFGTNVDTDGRFHSKWLNMMYPRLVSARHLLREDGVIFVSIDDHELQNLRKLMDEIFGEHNVCATFVWNTEGNTDNQYTIKINHEYVVAYYKNASHIDEAIGHVVDPNTREDSNLWKGVADNNINKNNPGNPPEIIELPVGFPSSEEQLFYSRKAVDQEFFEITRREKVISDTIKTKYKIEPLSGLPVKLDDMVIERSVLTQPCRIYGGVANRNKLLAFIKNGCRPILDDDGQPLRFYINANAGVRYRRENERPQNILSVLRNMGTTERTRGYLKQLGVPYDYAKPLALIEYLITIGCEPKDGLVLDFFGGSGTAAEAVANVNGRDQGRRQFICVQLPEPIANSSFANLAALCIERVKRAFQQLQGSQPHLPDATAVPSPDLGFRVMSLAESSFAEWNSDGGLPLTEQLELHIHHVRPHRGADDLLFEILLKEGYKPSTRIDSFDAEGAKLYSIAQGLLLVCLARNVTLDAIRAMAELAPQRVVCLDESFAGSDQLKANAVQIFRSKGIVFRTV